MTDAEIDKARENRHEGMWPTVSHETTVHNLIQRGEFGER